MVFCRYEICKAYHLIQCIYVPIIHLQKLKIIFTVMRTSHMDIFPVPTPITQKPPHPYTNNYWPILIFIIVMNFSILVAYMYFPINVILPVFNFVKWNKVYYMYSSITWYIIWHCTVSPILFIYRIQIHLLSKIISIFIQKLTFIFAEWWTVYF